MAKNNKKTPIEEYKEIVESFSSTRYYFLSSNVTLTFCNERFQETLEEQIENTGKDAAALNMKNLSSYVEMMNNYNYQGTKDNGQEEQFINKNALLRFDACVRKVEGCSDTVVFIYLSELRDTGPYSRSREHALTLLLKKKRVAEKEEQKLYQELLDHPLIVAIVRRKWRRVGLFIHMLNLALYLMFLFMFTTCILSNTPTYTSSSNVYNKIYPNDSMYYKNDVLSSRLNVRVHCNDTMNSNDTVHCTETMNPNGPVHCNESINSNETVHCNETMNSNDTVHCNETMNPNNTVNCNETMNSNDTVHCNETMNSNYTVHCNETMNSNDTIHCNETTNSNDTVHCNETANADDKEQCPVIDTKQAVVYLKNAVIAFSVIFLLKEAYQAVSMFRFRYFRMLENYWEVFVYTTSIMFVVNTSECEDRGHREVWQWYVGIISIFFAWINVLFFLKKIDIPFISGIPTSLFVRITKKFLLNVFVVLGVFIIAFGIVFHCIFRTQHGFETVWVSMTKTLAMMIGELEYTAIFIDETPQFFVLGLIFYLAFMFLMAIVIMNIMIGMAVEDVQEIQRSAVADNTDSKIEFVMHFEPLILRILNKFGSRGVKAADWVRGENYEIINLRKKSDTKGLPVRKIMDILRIIDEKSEDQTRHECAMQKIQDVHEYIKTTIMNTIEQNQSKTNDSMNKLKELFQTNVTQNKTLADNADWHYRDQKRHDMDMDMAKQLQNDIKRLLTTKMEALKKDLVK